MRRIQHKLLIYFLVLSIIPMLVTGTISYLISVRAIHNKFNESLMLALGQIQNNIDEKVIRVQKYMDLFITSKQIQEELYNIDTTEKQSEIYSSTVKLNQILSSYFYNDNDLEIAAIRLSSDRLYSYKGQIDDFSKEEPDWSKVIGGKNGEIVWIRTISKTNQQNNDQEYFLVGRLIKDSIYRKDINTRGVLLLFFDKSIFDAVDQTTNANAQVGTLIIMNKSNEVISCSDQSMAEDFFRTAEYKTVLDGTDGFIKCKVNGTNSMVLFTQSSVTGWKVINIIPDQYIVGEVNNIGWSVFILFIICIITVNIISFVLAKYISQPIQLLLQAMKKVGEKDFEVSLKLNNRDEIGLISEGFNLMVKDIQSLFNQVIQEEENKRKAQIKALRYQINPHFLYNALSSIRLTALNSQKTDDISDMLLVLSRYLRNTIARDDTLISIDEELFNLNDYISIYQIRYHNRINVTYEIEENIRSLYIPCMLLQPIIENSIMHGLNKKLNLNIEKAEIKLIGFMESDYIIFEIIDNGMGISKQMIDKIFDDEENKDSITPSHIGLKNIRNRIKLEYGNSYGLSIESEMDKYTKVTIILPQIFGGETNV